MNLRIAPQCADLQIVERKDRPDISDIFNQIYARYSVYGAGLVLTTGEVAFTCKKEDKPMKGYYFAGTQQTYIQGIGAGPWNMQYLAGFLAESDHADTAQAIGEHMLNTFQVNPDWAQRQQNLTAETSKVVSETHEHISRVINDTYWNRQGVMDEIDRRRSNAILGVVDVVDEKYGKEYKVENSSNYYWIDHRGNIVGTDTYTIPSIDFRELILLP